LPAVDQLSGSLCAEFPWADRVIDWVEANLRLANHVGASYFALAPMLLTGPPGCGKTRFVRRLAELAGTGFGMVGAAGSNDNRTLSGTARGWSNTCPALPLILIETHFRANPVILVDEIDKTATLSSAGRIIDSLLLLLEPETAARWFDECLLTRANLSAVTWICTANQASGLPAPLRSRLTVLPFGIPRDEDFPSIIAAIRRDLAREYRCDALALPELPHPIVEELRAAFRHHRDLRILRRLVVAALASATLDKPVTH
jgi:energy-coupling factor transporter ATP-binding protein EcfA2